MKEQTKKNILFITICILTISLLFIALKIDQKRKIELVSNSIIGEYLKEIKYDEILEHTTEQPNAIIYVTNSSDEKATHFDSMFKRIIKEYNLENKMVFININNTNLVDPIYQHSPELVFYENATISEVIDCTTLNDEKEIVQELELRGVIND